VVSECVTDEVHERTNWKVSGHMTRLRLKSALFTDGQIELDAADLPATIGRSPRADIVIHDLQLSRIHAEFRRNSKGEVELVDRDSTNLTIVNQQEIHACVLKSGDQILLGETELLVELDVSAAAIHDQPTREIPPPDLPLRGDPSADRTAS
jgi:predicted component of type VI protein secretion system